MATVEERFSDQEAKMEEVGKALSWLEAAIATLDQKIDQRFDAVDLKFARVNRFLFSILIVIIAELFGIVTKLV